jgi:molybdenum cofactor cytidylyltransferase
MVTLVDRPPPQSTTLQSLMDAFTSRDHGVWSVVPEFQGKHGHPILIGREMIEAFLRAPATSIARDIEHANEQRILYVPVNDPFVTTNIDTPEQYASLQSQS